MIDGDLEMKEEGTLPTSWGKQYTEGSSWQLGYEKPRVTKKLVWDLKFIVRDNKKPAKKGRPWKPSTDAVMEVGTQRQSDRRQEYAILGKCVGWSYSALDELGSFQLQ